MDKRMAEYMEEVRESCPPAGDGFGFACIDDEGEVWTLGSEEPSKRPALAVQPESEVSTRPWWAAFLRWAGLTVALSILWWDAWWEMRRGHSRKAA